MTGDMDRLREELIAYLEGELAPDARARVEQEVRESIAARAELDGLYAMYADIEAVERDARAPAPSIDIVDDVMRAVQKVTAPENVVPLRSARVGQARWWPALAAAAAIVLVAGYVAFRDDETKTPVSRLAEKSGTAQRPGQGGAQVSPDISSKLAKSIQALDKKRGELGHAGGGAGPLASTAGPILQLPGSVADVVEARAALGGQSASMQKLLDWARLDHKKALELADAPDTSPEVVLGVADSLSGDEQRRVLLTAVGRLENDPNSRMQLARNFVDDPGDDAAETQQNQTEALAQLSDVKSLDPDNALPYYYEAKVQLDAGDTEGALLSLQAAADLAEASAYALETALAQAKALEASGMEPDAARMVAALTAGLNENNFLCQLAGDLLKYAQGFMSANDPATAEAIYSGVEEMGRQVEAGADLSQEQLVGLDIQRIALEGLGQLYATVESAEGVAFVTDAAEALTADIVELAGFFNELDELFLAPMTTEFWNIVSGIVLATGDLLLFNDPQVAQSATR